MLRCKGPCGKPLPAWFKGERCDACRQKKSRDKRLAISRAHGMGFQVDQWAKMLSEGTIDHEHARELLDAVWDRLGDFYRQIQNAEAVAEAKAAEKTKAKR